MLATAASWGDVCNHSGFGVPCERVLEYLGEFAASEREMLLF